MGSKDKKLLRVGELAHACGKSVRAIHLYEELGLVTPEERSQGGFRLFSERSVDRINWIGKFQVMGFSLAEIRDFVEQFESRDSGKHATDNVREIFEGKLREVRETLRRLRVVETDLEAAIAYLESCQSCTTALPVTECAVCSHQGHEAGDAPELFAGLSTKVREDRLIAPSELVEGKN